MSIEVLLVDDHKIVRDGLGGMLSRQDDIEVVGYAENGLQAIEFVRDLCPDVVVMDVGMPELGGVEATRRIREEVPDTMVVALSMHSDWRYVAAMLAAGASGYVLKDTAFDELALAIRTVKENRQFISSAVHRSDFGVPLESITGTEPMMNARTPVASLFCRVIEIRDPYTAGHQRRVAELATAIAEDMGVSVAEIDDIRDAALMHDVGKMAVPAEILAKPGKLTSMEFELVKGHAEAGYQVLKSADLPSPLAELVYQHHERCDGSGYPRELTGDNMLDGAKILAVADVVEAMLSHRPYRASLGVDAALDEIEQGSGELYDTAAVESCTRVFRECDFEFFTKEEGS